MLRLCLTAFLGLWVAANALCAFSGGEDFLAFLPEACEGIIVPSFDAFGVKGWELKSQKAKWTKDRTLYMQGVELTYSSGAQPIYLDAREAELSEPFLVKMTQARATTQGFSLEGGAWVLHDQTFEIHENTRAVFSQEDPLVGDFMGCVN